MFPTSSEILKQREGSITETPLPLLLHAIAVEERTCAVELKVRALIKRISFEDGAPVACSSNLLHETLGKFLVQKGKLTEEQYQSALVESVNTGMRMGELLIKQQLISPYDLYKQLQANLALKILDSFRWMDASYRVIGDDPQPESPVRMNAAQLVLTGASTVLPFDVVTTHLMFVDEQRFALVPDAKVALDELRLSTRDAKLIAALRTRPTFPELLARCGLEFEEALRRLYALCVLQAVAFAEAVPEVAAPVASAARAPVAVPAIVPAAFAAATVGGAIATSAPAAPVLLQGHTSQAVPAPAASPGVAYSDEDEPLRNALVAAFMTIRSSDAFDLLGVGMDVGSAELRKSFLGRCDRFSPVRFKTSDLREKAEALLVAYARAFGGLSDPEQLTVHRNRRKNAEAAKKSVPTGRPTAAEQFRIRTDLLDASTQFKEGKQRLEQGEYRAALELLQYAADIEPRGEYRAHLARARYLLDPSSFARLALQELTEAARVEPLCEWVHLFAGQIHQGEGDFEKAEESFKLAFKSNPRERKYADLANEMAKLRKKR
ncbi:MAG: DUF4388 domain-containing protein [Myxococcota bacterium]|nr:DUF4388 domain-containing protein [Myxococcota bacterium]